MTHKDKYRELCASAKTIRDEAKSILSAASYGQGKAKDEHDELATILTVVRIVKDYTNDQCFAADKAADQGDDRASFFSDLARKSLKSFEWTVEQLELAKEELTEAKG